MKSLIFQFEVKQEYPPYKRSNGQSCRVTPFAEGAKAAPRQLRRSTAALRAPAVEI
jgi:hypothetical protein